MLFNLKKMKTAKAQAEFTIVQQIFSFTFHIQSAPNILRSVLIFYFHQSSFTKDILQKTLSWLLSYYFL